MTQRSSAWRFSFDAAGASGHPVGLTLSARGAIDLVDGIDALRQSLLLLIATRPGERVMRPEYGCHLFRLAFAPNDDTTAGLAIHYVQQALTRWEPRIEVLRLDANVNPEQPGQLDIHLQYRERGSAHGEQVALSFDLASGRMR